MKQKSAITKKGHISQVDVYTGRNLRAHCYDTDPIDVGWCATCIKGAAKGTTGYCGPGETKDIKEAPDISSNSTNWGFCNPHCTKGGTQLTSTIQVMNVDPL